MYGYAGRILRVDLSTGRTETEPLKEELAKNYIGGIGLGIRLLLDNLKLGTDPFSPKNPHPHDRPPNRHHHRLRMHAVKDISKACFIEKNGEKLV